MKKNRSRAEILQQRLYLSGVLTEQYHHQKTIEDMPKPVKPVIAFGSALLLKLIKRGV